MKRFKNQIAAIFLILAFLMLILDTRCAIKGVAEGIELCVNTVIPSIFPFMVLAPMVLMSLPSLPILHPLEKLLRIPRNSSILFIGSFLCGYPVGAKLISEAYKNGRLEQRSAARMLSFCNNAGPSFIFGIGASLFSSAWYAWSVWGIHIISCLIVGYLMPGQSTNEVYHRDTRHASFRATLENSVKSIGYICGWIIILRMLYAFLSRWFLWFFPGWVQTILFGLLELAGGCISLHSLQNTSLRFVIFSAFLAFGGISIHMQTASVIQIPGGIRSHLMGKLLHCLTSIFLSSGFLWIFTRESILQPITFSCIPILFYTVLRLKAKKGSIMKLCDV